MACEIELKLVLLHFPETQPTRLAPREKPSDCSELRFAKPGAPRIGRLVDGVTAQRAKNEPSVVSLDDIRLRIGQLCDERFCPDFIIIQEEVDWRECAGVHEDAAKIVDPVRLLQDVETLVSYRNFSERHRPQNVGDRRTLLSTTFENGAVATLENEATQTDWMGDYFGRLGVDQEACRGRGAAAAGCERFGCGEVDGREGGHVHEPAEV